MKDDLRSIQAEFHAALKSASAETDLAELRVRFLGKKGSLTGILRGLGQLGPEERQTFGKRVNDLKADMERALEAKSDALLQKELKSRLEAEWVDVTFEGLPLQSQPASQQASRWGSGKRPVGNLHPLTQIQYEVEDVFMAMGFEILDGPQVETEYFNFEALNIPKDHPARDMQDTFYLEDGNLLRTHTSPIQVRGMQRLRPPFKILAPGKVFRCERIDASHESTFHQVEGMMVDKDIKVAHLIFFLKALLSAIFGREEEVRLRPGYFPFVEPGFEVDIRCLLCRGKGCSVCKQVGWLELVPCGMVHPNVLRAGKVDPNEYSGFAFGLGLDRLVMMRYGIEDIRHLHGADLRFIEQFR